MLKSNGILLIHSIKPVKKKDLVRHKRTKIDLKNKKGQSNTLLDVCINIAEYLILFLLNFVQYLCTALGFQ